MGKRTSRWIRHLAMLSVLGILWAGVVNPSPVGKSPTQLINYSGWTWSVVDMP